MTRRSPTLLLDVPHAECIPARCASVRARNCSRDSHHAVVSPVTGPPSITDFTFTTTMRAPTWGLRRTKSP